VRKNLRGSFWEYFEAWKGDGDFYIQQSRAQFSRNLAVGCQIGLRSRPFELVEQEQIREATKNLNMFK